MICKVSVPLRETESNDDNESHHEEVCLMVWVHSYEQDQTLKC